MTDTLDTAAAGDDLTSTTSDATKATAKGAARSTTRKRGGGLNSMLLADLKAMAAGMGIAGAGSMKKAALVDAIKAAQASGPTPAAAPEAPAAAPEAPSERTPAAAVEPGPATEPTTRVVQRRRGAPKQDQPTDQSKDQPTVESDQPSQDKPTPDQPQQGEASEGEATQEGPKQGQRAARRQSQKQKQGQARQDNRSDQKPDQRPEQKADQRSEQKADQRSEQKPDQRSEQKADQRAEAGDQARDAQRSAGEADEADNDDDGEGGSRRSRRRRGRERGRTTRSGREPDTEVREDDVLVPAAGILDVLDNYAFVRTSGYLAGVDDVYLSLSMVRKYGLRRGDAITGQVRQPRDGERREKFNPMVRVETVNGVDPEQSRDRPEFAALVPVSPTKRLRMETTSDNLVGRVIDLAAPVGKGQRGLIASPPSAGKTTLLQSIAASVTANNPECHLMVVLVDERPEEVTEFQRSIKGEVIASTFDRPAADHVTVAELAVERAKRLVELGHDVVVLLDGLTRLARAHNVAAPAGGRALGGGMDAGALFGPKRLFGAARAVEHGGSLTILATVSVDTGSAVDEAVLEELRGTDNLEIRLRGDLAARRVFPAIDVLASGTRREELLLGAQEVDILWTLRRGLAVQGYPEAATGLLDQLRATATNYELLVKAQRHG